MLPFSAAAGMALKTFVGFATVYTASPGTWVEVPVPAGASTLMAETIGGGGAGAYSSAFDANVGGGGGGYARRNAFSVAGVASVWIRVGPRNSGSPVSCIVRASSTTGTIVAEANPGDEGSGYNANGGTGVVGDVLVSGQSRNALDGQGKAAAGPNGLGVSPAGAAGNSNLYGGGGNSTPGPGAQGWIRLTWS